MTEATYFPQVRVANRDSPFDGQTVALAVVDGTIEINPAAPPANATVVEFDGLHVSPGWADFGAALHEPGHEHKETLDSLLAAAQAGGYTHVTAFPETEPVVDDATALKGLLALAPDDLGVGLGIIGALSKGKSGEQLAVTGEMADAGVGFVGDGLRAVEDPKLLQLALTYAQAFGVAVVTQPGERRLEGAGQMHEGEVSTALGLPGLAAMTEEIGVARDLRLREYTGGRLHFHALTLAATLEAAAFAKTQSASVSYGVPVLNLLLTDQALDDYDATAKVLPPLREAPDRDALHSAIFTGAADVLVSNHRPHDTEESRVEFPYAAFGAATLELAFAIAATATDAATAADYLGRRNRAFCGLAPATIEDGARAELTLFLPEATFEVPERALRSLGVNVPLVGRKLTGVPAGTFAECRWRPSPWLATLSLG